MFELGGFPPESSYLFLGNYIDKGKHGIETICLLLAYKIKYPESFFILRGAHECAAINRVHGFFCQCKARFNIKLWKEFNKVFNCLPFAAVINNKIFCVHAGPSRQLTHLDKIAEIIRPTQIPDTGLLYDLLRSNPKKDIQGWSDDNAGPNSEFGSDVVESFLIEHDLNLICRSHQILENGYELFADNGLVTLFSVTNYCGVLDNSAAIMSVNEKLECSFQVWEPEIKLEEAKNKKI